MHAYLINQQEKQISSVEKTCKDGFPVHDGPFIRHLDKTLKDMHVNKEHTTVELLRETMFTDA